jgi:hypothetical protein
MKDQNDVDRDKTDKDILDCLREIHKTLKHMNRTLTDIDGKLGATNRNLSNLLAKP